MKKLKYFSVLMLVAILSLTGCSFGGKKLSAKEKLEKALINLAKADSFTVKLSVKGEVEDNDVDGSLLLKVAKDGDYYNLYLGLEASSDMLDDDLEMEGYLLTSKKNTQLYLNLGGYDWSHIKVDNDELDEAANVDVSDYAKGVDEKEIKSDLKKLKSVKEGKTKDGLTEIIVTVDKDDVADSGYELEKDVKFSVWVDKDNNLAKIDIDPAQFGDEAEDLKLTIEFKKINDTKVKVPSDVKEDAEDVEIEEFVGSLMQMFGFGDYTDDYDDDYDDDDDVDYDNDKYTSDKILYDILLSAGIKTCSSGDFKVDFKDYHDELYLYDDEYDIKRIEDGELTFTKAENGSSCNIEVTRPIIIDGKTCTVTDMDYYEGECK